MLCPMDTLVISSDYRYYVSDGRLTSLNRYNVTSVYKITNVVLRQLKKKQNLKKEAALLFCLM